MKTNQHSSSRSLFCYCSEVRVSRSALKTVLHKLLAFLSAKERGGKRRGEQSFLIGFTTKYTTVNEDGILNNYANEPQMYYTEYPAIWEQRKYVVQSVFATKFKQLA